MAPYMIVRTKNTGSGAGAWQIGDVVMTCDSGEYGLVNEGDDGSDLGRLVWDASKNQPASGFGIAFIADATSKADLDAYIEEVWDTTDPDHPVLLKRRLDFIDDAKWNPGERGDFQANLQITTTLARLAEVTSQH